MELEHITPYGEGIGKGEQVEQMFDNIAPAYDLMNRAMTLGIDRRWRRKAVRQVQQVQPRAILDVATGTGDLALQLARSCPQVHITGIDLSEGMLAVGRQKVAKAEMAERITLRAADCLALPFADASFDAITVAFGVRNFAHLDRGYAEMARVLRPGGRLCVLELSTPSSPLVKPFYHLYTRGLIPWLGRRVSSDPRAYSYLLESIAAVPQGQAMCQLIRSAGFATASAQSLTMGVCTLYTASR